jgi:mono/diheme cytochrome c family protein
VKYAQVFPTLVVLSGLPFGQAALAAPATDQMPMEEGHWEAPAYARSLKPPMPLTASAARQGQNYFQEFCAACHGADGHGRGWLAGSLAELPPNLAHSAAEHAPGELVWKIATGRALMPGWGRVLSEMEIWALAAYISTLAPHSQDHRQERTGHE